MTGTAAALGFSTGHKITLPGLARRIPHSTAMVEWRRIDRPTLASAIGRGYIPSMAQRPTDYVVRDNPAKHRFEVDLGDGSFAIAQYTLPDGKIMFTHTEVPPAYEGKGVGSALIRFALASARARELEVIPICPFFAAYIRKHAEEQDLLGPTYRKILGVE